MGIYSTRLPCGCSIACGSWEVRNESWVEGVCGPDGTRHIGDCIRHHREIALDDVRIRSEMELDELASRTGIDRARVAEIRSG